MYCTVTSAYYDGHFCQCSASFTGTETLPKPNIKCFRIRLYYVAVVTVKQRHLMFASLLRPKRCCLKLWNYIRWQNMITKVSLKKQPAAAIRQAMPKQCMAHAQYVCWPSCGLADEAAQQEFHMVPSSPFSVVHPWRSLLDSSNGTNWAQVPSLQDLAEACRILQMNVQLLPSRNMHT